MRKNFVYGQGCLRGAIKYFCKFSCAFYFICCLAIPRLTLRHCREDSLKQPMFINACFLLRPESHSEPGTEVGSEGPINRSVGFLSPNFRLLFNVLTNWATLPKWKMCIGILEKLSVRKRPSKWTYIYIQWFFLLLRSIWNLYDSKSLKQ